MNTNRIRFVLALVAFLAISSFALASPSNRLVINGKSRFISGMNLAWNSFGDDFADDVVNASVFQGAVQAVRDSGGNALRVWVFTNNSYAPHFDANGYVSGLGTSTIANLKKVLDLADSNGVLVSLCLLSFDMMQPGEWSYNTAEDSLLKYNIKMLNTDSGTNAFINNALVPLVTALKDHPSIMSWEIFNEPEGMVKTSGGWATDDTDITVANLQRFANKAAAAIKKNDPNHLVSSDAVTFATSSTVSTFQNLWSDSALIAQGGDQTGTLDFIQVHYYPDYGDSSKSPFVHPASYWGVNKPIVIGEFPANTWGGNCKSSANIDSAYAYLYKNGYAGAMSWSYDGFNDTSNGCVMTGSVLTAGPAMHYVFNLDSIAGDSAVKIRNVTRAAAGTNDVMAVVLSNLSGTEYPEIFVNKSYTLAGITNWCVDLKVDANSTGTLKVQPVFKDNAWTWSASGDYPIISTSWTTVCEPITSYNVATPNINAMELQLMAGSASFTGTLYVDNVRFDTDTLYNFNDGYSVWSLYGGDAATKAAVTNIVNVPLAGPVAALTPSYHARNMQVNQVGRMLNIDGTAGMQVEIADLQGHIVLRETSVQNHLTVNLQDIHAGVYVVKTLQASAQQVQRIALY